MGVEWGREIVKGSQKILNKNCKDTTGASITTAIIYLSNINCVSGLLKDALLW